MVQMYDKTDNCLVEVYEFSYAEHSALVFSPSLAGKQNGNGWKKTKLKNLIPLEYYKEYARGFMSKSEKNKIKKRLTLTSAIWTCTDGTEFTDCEAAIKHEYELVEEEENYEALA